MAAGSATCHPTSMPAAGSHTITGLYSPDPSDGTFEQSTSQPLTQTVTPAPPVTTTPPTPSPPATAPTTGASPPVQVASATATSTAGVIELNGSHSSAVPGRTITGYAWYLGTKLIGRTETVRYRVSPADARKTVTLRVTDSAGATATAQVVLSTHVHTTSVSLSAATVFAFNSARLTPAATRLLTKIRPVILASPRVTIDGYTAEGPQTNRQENYSQHLSTQRAKTVEAFLFGGRRPDGTRRR